MASGTSYNGWPASDDRASIGVDANALGAGVKFPSGIKGGDVAKVLGYVADQLQARVEQVTVNPDGTGYGCWGHTYKANVNNPSQLSCHASGTAIDWIAPSHPNGSGGTFSDQQRATIYAILDECQGGVNWLEGYDEMHFEIGVSATTLANIAATLPGGTPPEPPKEWDEMASQAEVQQAVNDGVINVLRGGEAQEIIRNQVANVLRADEFNLEAGPRYEDTFRAVTDVLHSPEFDLGATRRDTRDTKADTTAILGKLA